MCNASAQCATHVSLTLQCATHLSLASADQYTPHGLACISRTLKSRSDSSAHTHRSFASWRTRTSPPCTGLACVHGSSHGSRVHGPSPSFTASQWPSQNFATRRGHGQLNPRFSLQGIGARRPRLPRCSTQPPVVVSGPPFGELCLCHDVFVSRVWCVVPALVVHIDMRMRVCRAF